ncbi:MAG: serine/threonine-protein kinase, partial [Myxococcota bacterium]
EAGLENLVRLAAQYDDEEADARAARFASTLAPTLQESLRIALGQATARSRAAAINAVEGCGRSLALRLWGPMLATRPDGDPIQEPDLTETFALLARTPAELLDLVAEHRRTLRQQAGVGAEAEAAFAARESANLEVALEVLALKLGGYALDAIGEEAELGPGRGQLAHDTCLWLRKLEGLTDGSRELPRRLRSALSALFWRLVDSTRGTSLGEVDDVAWLGPFAAWWALVIDRPAVLQQLATALPMIADGALETCCTLADATRDAIEGAAADGAWRDVVSEKLEALHADGTELAVALAHLGQALEDFGAVKGGTPQLEAFALGLVLAAERLQAALADPVRGLRPAADAPMDDSLGQRTQENAPRTAAMITRAIRTREVARLEVWLASVGPTVAGLVEPAIEAAIQRTPPPPPIPKKAQPKQIVGYELVKPLGEGGVGSVFLVRKPGADRMFVLKIPKADALESATDTEREAILASFVDEAKALAGLYHPNVANIIDRGVDGQVPYLVLEYLIGADLKDYSRAKPMSLFELRKSVEETCAGLSALHNAGLVHRDIKPANLYLRLPLAGGVRFDPEKHRNPAHTTPLATVIIDFGMVRAQKVAAEVGGRFVAGTAGYIAPEQVLDPVELDGRADVYSLAGTVVNVTSGRTFFDDIDNQRERILAHMRENPLDRLTDVMKAYPAGLVKLLRAATATSFEDRPTPLEFSRAYADVL